MDDILEASHALLSLAGPGQKPQGSSGTSLQSKASTSTLLTASVSTSTLNALLKDSTDILAGASRKSSALPSKADSLGRHGNERGPDKKKRKREEFNQAQLKRLIEVYDMQESQRPDADQLAKELDRIEGGRHCDVAAVKAWMKNRYHTLKRTAGTRTLASDDHILSQRKERQNFNTSQLKRLSEVYEMDPSQRPDREIVANEIDNLDGGRSVTQYDVLAWMQVCTPGRARALTHTPPAPSPAHTHSTEREEEGKIQRVCERSHTL
jgi:hypothetical protein